MSDLSVSGSSLPLHVRRKLGEEQGLPVQIGSPAGRVLRQKVEALQAQGLLPDMEYTEEMSRATCAAMRLRLEGYQTDY